MDMLCFKRFPSLAEAKNEVKASTLMHQDINLLILDEPTNHLDIDSKEVLEEALEDFQGSIVAVSHDRYFLNKLFHQIYWIESNRLHFFHGDYNWAKEKMTELRVKNMSLTIDKKIPQSKKKVRNDAVDQKLEADLVSLESKIEVLDKRLMETKDLDLLQQLYKEKEGLELEWETLCDKLEN